MYRVLLPVDESESRVRAQVEAVLENPVAVGDLIVDLVHDNISASAAAI